MSDIIKLADLPCHIDNRGNIKMILESCEIGSISRIESFPEMERANHYHIFQESHYILVNEGQIEYFEREFDSDRKPDRYILNKGDLFFTRPEWSHTMYFPAFTIFDCYSRFSRKQDSYEKLTIKFDYSLRRLYYNQ